LIAKEARQVAGEGQHQHDDVLGHQRPHRSFRRGHGDVLGSDKLGRKQGVDAGRQRVDPPEASTHLHGRSEQGAERSEDERGVCPR
jgi:hypothetical protein